MGILWGSSAEESGKIESLQRSIKALEDAVEHNRSKAEEAENALKKYQVEAEKAIEELDAANKRVQELEGALTSTNDELTSIKKSTAEISGSHNVEIDELKAKLLEREVEVEALKNEIAELKASAGEKYDAKPAVEIPDYSSKLDELNAEMAKFNKVYQEQVRRDELMNSMHKEVDNLRNDVYSKLLRPYKLSIISLYDSIARTYEYYSAEARKDEADAYGKLLKQIENYMLSIIDTLCDEYNLDSFEAAVGEPFNRSAYKTMNIIETDDPAKNNTVAKAHQCGFKYTAYDAVKGVERDVVFRQAFVDVFKYKNNN